MFRHLSTRIKVRVYDGWMFNFNVYLTIMIFSFLIIEWPQSEFEAVLPQLSLPVTRSAIQAEISYVVDGEIFHTVIESDLQTTTVITEGFPPVASWPSWSPDGSALAFVGASGLENAQDIYLYKAGQHMRLTETLLRKSNLRWSPDGQQLAFVQVDSRLQQSSLWVLSLATGQLENVSRPIEGCCYTWLNDQTLGMIDEQTQKLKVIGLDQALNDQVIEPASFTSLKRSSIQPALFIFRTGGGFVTILDEPVSHFLATHYATKMLDSTWQTKLLVFNASGTLMLEYEDVQFGQYAWRPLSITTSRI